MPEGPRGNERRKGGKAFTWVRIFKATTFNLQRRKGDLEYWEGGGVSSSRKSLFSGG